MWLKFGVARSGELTSIDQVVRGKTQLTCLYCGGLTAKKGSVKEHHFAHTEESCKPVSQRIKTKAFPSLPLYDNFNIDRTYADTPHIVYRKMARALGQAS